MGGVAQLMANRNRESEQAKKEVKTNCNMVKIIIVKVDISLEAVRAICLHHETQMDFMELEMS